MVKRGNLKRSKLAANQSMNENSFMNSVLGDGMVDQKDGSTTHIQSTAQAQGEISLRKYMMNFLIQITIVKGRISLFNFFPA